MSSPAPADLRLMYFDDCPNWRLADARLKEALDSVGADPSSVVYVRVTSAEQADAAGFRGSPTILMDGSDPFADGEAPTGLSCRIYRTPLGVEPAPTVEQLRAVLSR